MPAERPASEVPNADATPYLATSVPLAPTVGYHIIERGSSERAIAGPLRPHSRRTIRKTEGNGTLTTVQLKKSLRAGLLGYGFLRAWIVLYLLFSRQVSVERFWYPLVLLSSVAASALAVIWLRRQAVYKDHEPLFDVLFLGCGALGTCFTFFGNLLDGTTYLNVGFLAIGLCAGYFEVRWSERFLPYSDKLVYCNLLLAFLLAAVIGIVSSALLPESLLLVESLALIVCMGALYFSSRNDGVGAQAGGRPDAEELDGKAAAQQGSTRSRKMLFNVTMTAMLFSFVQMSATSICYSTLPVNDVYWGRFIANFATAALLVAIFLLRGALSPLGLLKALLPVTATGLFLQILDPSVLSLAPIVILLVGNKLFDVLILVLLIKLSQRGLVNPAVSFSLFVAGKNIGSALGSAVGDTMVSAMGTDPTALSLFIGILEVLLLVSFLWMFSLKQMNPARDDAQNGAAVDGDGKAAQKDGDSELRMSGRAAAVAERFGLTPKETEVLQMLARGKNRETIACDLHLSKSTVHTHMIHIYQKTGVHGQQELIKLVENVSADESLSTKQV